MRAYTSWHWRGCRTGPHMCSPVALEECDFSYDEASHTPSWSERLSIKIILPPPSQGVPRELSFLRENPAPSESPSSNSQQHTPHQPHSRPHPKTSHYPTPQRTSPKHTRSQTLGVEAPCAPRCRTSVARIMWHPPEGLWGGEGARTGGEGGWGDEAGCHRTPGAPPLTPSISPSHPA